MRILLAAILFFAAEVVVLVEVARAVGVLSAVGLLVVLSLCGPWLIRRSGLGAWRRVRARLAEGKAPGRELVDGVVVLFAGALVTVPGFITDVIGLVLLLPPVRSFVRNRLIRRWEARVLSSHLAGNGARARSGFGLGSGFGSRIGFGFGSSRAIGQPADPAEDQPGAGGSVEVQSSDVTDHDVTDHDVTDHDVTDHDVTDHDVTDHDVTDHDVTDHDVTDHHEVGHYGRRPDGEQGSEITTGCLWRPPSRRRDHSQVAVRDAATVMVLRDSESGLEVLMLRRNLQSAFAGDTFVFPGGAIDAEDSHSDLADVCCGRSDQDASRPSDLPRWPGFWVGAIRECFEEAGVLLANDRCGPLNLCRPDVAERYRQYRRQVHDRVLGLGRLCRDEGLMIDVGRVEYFSHWITPAGYPVATTPAFLGHRSA